MDHFGDKNMEIDILVDADKGIMKMKRVGFLNDDKYEIQISGIHNCPDNINGSWIPHFIFGSSKNSNQEIRIAKIDRTWYGKHQDIKWY